MNETLLTALSVISTICAILFGYKAFVRNRDKDKESDARTDATVLTEIGYIKSNTDEIKAEQKEQRKTNLEFISRLTAVEASAKQAHKRIDTLEGRE
jgi:hypothetical protein